MLIIHPSTRFKRSYKRMPAKIKKDFIKRIAIFQKEPFYPSLNIHKLSGKLDEYYSFYLRDGYRVLFDFVSEDTVVLVNIGSHNDYRKWGC
ncbi:type II toxin-antitoxin system mRNA interferase toxin, RelE/StbE family [Candidatus Shapirobacteria bacterium CG10_big_fil_rev_8_21_14_0_10_38_14]|uniref:Type II toxin-antitoxin system mRNA interferase toxin, RelE/StbE family n=1 Tax=Candidatus Shapirobacteria bacterium CG10_big_fil_rev_8_21_14_0_10_38_14 TaxID=1974483 RepID=A0A2M8L568_9BACT|nr:MAG: type II toxin-antitoxin system mRNA interferase toxin, RelE/StbE family [Candidatus Shapirobacteria bacterium CG10_big_fil_rev_8_21_14_0_10_38_14]